MGKNSFKTLENITEKKSKEETTLKDNSKDILEDAFKDDIEKSISDIANKVRKFVKDQKDDWQKLPYLALQADGRSGYSDYRQKIYRTGYLPLSTFSNNYDIYIDCASGELYDSILNKNNPTPADDDSLVFLAMRLDTLDAKSRVEEFEKSASEPIASYYNIKENEKWRSDLTEELGLKMKYVRD